MRLSICLMLFAIILTGCKKDAQLKVENMNVVVDEKVKSITVFVHGTHTDILTQIFKKTLLVPNKLTKATDLHKDSYVKWFIDKVSAADPVAFPLDSFYAIGWSGMLSSQERLKAAQNLYNELIKLTTELHAKGIETKITVIGHSHGGNVGLNLARLRLEATSGRPDARDKDLKINRLVLLATPVQEETKDLVNNDMFERVYSIYSKADLIQVLDPQGLQSATKTFFSERRFMPCAKLKQVKVKVNNRAILHEEFVFHNFPKVLPKLLNVMDELICDDKEHLVKIEYKNKKIKNIEIKVKEVGKYL